MLYFNTLLERVQNAASLSHTDCAQVEVIWINHIWKQNTSIAEAVWYTNIVLVEVIYLKNSLFAKGFYLGYKE